MGFEENRTLASHSSSNLAPQRTVAVYKEIFPHEEDQWAVLTWSMLGKGATSQKWMLNIVKAKKEVWVLLGSVMCQKNPHSLHCFEWEENSVVFPLCNKGTWLSIGCCQSPVFRETKATLWITSAPTTPAWTSVAKMVLHKLLFKPNPNPLHLKWKLSNFSCGLRGIMKEDVLK